MSVPPSKRCVPSIAPEAIQEYSQQQGNYWYITRELHLAFWKAKRSTINCWVGLVRLQYVLVFDAVAWMLLGCMLNHFRTQVACNIRWARHVLAAMIGPSVSKSKRCTKPQSCATGRSWVHHGYTIQWQQKAWLPSIWMYSRLCHVPLQHLVCWKVPGMIVRSKTCINISYWFNPAADHSSSISRACFGVSHHITACDTDTKLCGPLVLHRPVVGIPSRWQNPLEPHGEAMPLLDTRSPVFFQHLPLCFC